LFATDRVPLLSMQGRARSIAEGLREATCPIVSLGYPRCRRSGRSTLSVAGTGGAVILGAVRPFRQPGCDSARRLHSIRLGRLWGHFPHSHSPTTGASRWSFLTRPGTSAPSYWPFIPSSQSLRDSAVLASSSCSFLTRLGNSPHSFIKYSRVPSGSGEPSPSS